MDATGIQPDSGKMSAIENLLTPQNISFLRCFMPSYAVHPQACIKQISYGCVLTYTMPGLKVDVRVESGPDDPDNLGHLGHLFGGSSGSHP